MSADDLVALVGGSAGAVLLAVVIARYAWVHRSRLITPRAAETVGTQLERHFLDLFTNQDEALVRGGVVYGADDATRRGYLERAYALGRDFTPSEPIGDAAANA